MMVVWIPLITTKTCVVNCPDQEDSSYLREQAILKEHDEGLEFWQKSFDSSLALLAQDKWGLTL